VVSSQNVAQRTKERFVPDFCHDLNAMHEAENIGLNCDTWLEYERTLGLVVFDFKIGAYGKLLVHATARQRAEAFLRTLGRWDYSPRQPEAGPAVPDRPDTGKRIFTMTIHWP